MRYRNQREHTREESLRNETKTDQSMSKNSFVTTIEEPALNESGVIAKKKGF
ncbi:hypothetical protein [Inconstantimicrobium mannanitabidum]|uniref:Uncharacterized protein n=1 Tax=Inconstantimicrobium mannanitabidum TaxID=1604901 RepID=A0ACB5RD65_9CLOT|nr:hypothetical protein [Clostridium sp. TW13]GKX67107.1 hypothetical protein rsdtw13_23650 [Clostridium sp. TW13]